MAKYLLAMCTPMPKKQCPDGEWRLEPIRVEWHRARMGLGTPTNTSTIELRVDGDPVDVARCKAVNLAMDHDPRPEFLWFHDYDVIPNFDAITKLVYRARCYPDYDIFAGVYCCKSSPPEPLIYKDNGGAAFWDWALGDLILEGVTGVHMGLTLIRMSLFDRMEFDEDNPLFLTTNEKVLTPDGALRNERGTEDIFFCNRATTEADAKILVDTSVLAGHINNETGVLYGLPIDSPPMKRAKWYKKSSDDGEETGDDPELKALDIGAGEIRREWEGYKTYTTDIRSDVGADYVMDTRLLNLPDDSFDLLASNHHLEHIGRYEQDKVWTEMFRVLKPGGRMEHKVPNLMWAAHKLMDGSHESTVWDVFYGGQEDMGYERQYNTHYFGYTPTLLEAAAVKCGLVDVEVKSYKDDPDLMYDMVVTGRKPDAEEKNETTEETPPEEPDGDNLPETS